MKSILWMIIYQDWFDIRLYMRTKLDGEIAGRQFSLCEHGSFFGRKRMIFWYQNMITNWTFIGLILTINIWISSQMRIFWFISWTHVLISKCHFFTPTEYLCTPKWNQRPKLRIESKIIHWDESIGETTGNVDLVFPFKKICIRLILSSIFI